MDIPEWTPTTAALASERPPLPAGTTLTADSRWTTRMRTRNPYDLLEDGIDAAPSYASPCWGRAAVSRIPDPDGCQQLDHGPTGMKTSPANPDPPPDP